MAITHGYPGAGEQVRERESSQVVVLPPVESKSGLKCQLTKLRQIQVNAARTEFNLGLQKLRDTHVRNEEQRHEALIKEQNRVRKREAKQERIRLKHYHATKIQALIRSFFVRAFVLPSVLETKATAELKRSRVALSETMLCLHQNIHDLAFIEQDRCVSATRIQAWWRGVFAKRIVAIISLRIHLFKMGKRMDQAATRIAAYHRGQQARMGCTRLRLEREKRMQQANKKKEAQMIRAIIKVQSHIRRRMAMKNIQVRREALSKELEGEAGTTSEALD